MLKKEKSYFVRREKKDTRGEHMATVVVKKTQHIAAHGDSINVKTKPNRRKKEKPNSMGEITCRSRSCDRELKFKIEFIDSVYFIFFG